MIGGRLIAGDSTKLRAQNSKKNNYNLKKVQRHLAYIDGKLEEYNQALATEDDEDHKKEIQQQIQKQQERKKQYEVIDQKLNESGDKQLSVSDPESGQMIIGNNITEVAIPGVPKTSQSPDPAYNVEHFQYCGPTDSYICPQGNTLTTNGNWYNGEKYRFKQYKTSACQTCVVKQLCSTARYGKIVQRSEYTPAVEQNKKWITEHTELYKQRQAIVEHPGVEHPFGTIKRQWPPWQGDTAMYLPRKECKELQPMWALCRSGTVYCIQP